MELVILTVVVIGLGLYLAPSETKGSLKWGKEVVTGVGSDMKAIHLKAKTQAIENPESTKATYEWLNETVIDAPVYNGEATLRRMEAAAALSKAQADILDHLESK